MAHRTQQNEKSKSSVKENFTRVELDCGEKRDVRETLDLAVCMR